MSLIQEDSHLRNAERASVRQAIDSRRLTIPASSIKNEIRDFCINITEEFLAIYLKEECKVFQGLAEKIKNAMDKTWGPTWHVCVGTHFGSYVGYEKNHMIGFAIQKYNFLIWKHL